MKRILLGVLASAILASAATASLYEWNPTKRPAVSLEDALRQARELLGDDADHRYCVGAWLFGNKESDGKRGRWNLDFAAADGSIKHVTINMKGDTDVRYHPPIDWNANKGRRSGLADVQRRINTLFTKKGIDAAAKLQNDHLSVRYKTQVFKVHSKAEDGEYGNELQDVVGPMKAGIVIDIHESDRRDRNWDTYTFGVYGNGNRAQYLLTGESRYLNVDLRYGDGLAPSPFGQDQLILQLYQVFGERTPWP